MLEIDCGFIVSVQVVRRETEERADRRPHELETMKRKTFGVFRRKITLK